MQFQKSKNNLTVGHKNQKLKRVIKISKKYVLRDSFLTFGASIPKIATYILINY